MTTWEDRLVDCCFDLGIVRCKALLAMVASHRGDFTLPLAIEVLACWGRLCARHTGLL